MKIYLMSFLLLIASVLRSSAQAESKKFALIVGNANYPAVLPNATNDADDLALVLRQLGFKVILRKNLAKKDFEELIYLLKDSLASYDVGLFFFAGHGLEVGGVNYLIPIDTREKLAEEDVAYQCIPTDWIQQKMINSGTKTNIVILDACRNNPFRSWRTLSDRAWARSQSANLSGMITCYAASQGHKASDGTGRNGSYTAALLKYIKTPDLNIYQLFEKVRRDLARNGSQLPIEENALMESFSFNPSSSFPSHVVNASDSDADGILDSEDDCPLLAGIIKGCPDSDGDGVTDNNDKCPNTKGSPYNWGCPIIKVEDKKILDVAIRAVQFQSGTAIITRSSFKNLNDVLSVLNKYPELNLSLEGHTDSDGDDALNQKLSEKRVKACGDYLIKKGISSDRLKYIGYGETKPIGNNKTKEGKELNRRTEFNPFWK